MYLRNCNETTPHRAIDIDTHVRSEEGGLARNTMLHHGTVARDGVRVPTTTIATTTTTAVASATATATATITYHCH